MGDLAFNNPSFRVNSTFLAPIHLEALEARGQGLETSHPGPQVSQSHRFVDFLRFLLGFPFN